MTTKPTNPFEYGKDPELNRIFDSLIALRERVSAQFAKAEKIAGLGDVSSFVQVKDVKATLPNYRHERTQSSYSKTPLDVIDRKVQSAITETRAAIAEAEEHNRPLDEQNRQLVQQVKELMARLGIGASYTTYEYPTSRSKTKKSVVHTAGYISDLERACPKSNITSAKYQLDSYVREYDSWVRQEKEIETKEKIAKDEAAVQKNILGNPDLVATLMQAGVNILEEVQKAVPGQKSAVIVYCVAKAVENVQNWVEPNEELIVKLQNFI